MSVTSGFYNSVNGDKKYDAKQISNLFDGVINDGVFASIGTTFVVVPTTGMVVSAGVGRAWFNRTWTYNDAALPLVVSQSEIALNRIDAVVLEVNSSESVRTNSIKIIKGTPGSTPANPTMVRTDLVNQYPLAYIYVGFGVSTILQANITNCVGTAACPFVTGILQTTNIDALLAQWKAQADDNFTNWFNGVKGQLSTDAAGNLQNQIDVIKTLSGAISPTTATVGAVGQFYLNTVSKKIYQCVTVAGSVYTWLELSPFTIGSICSTIASSLGSDWALCNGSEVVQATYPALYSILPDSITSSSYGSCRIGPYDTISEKSIYYKGFYYITQYAGSVTDKLYRRASLVTGSWTEVTPIPPYHGRLEIINDYLVIIGNNGTTSMTAYLYSSDGTNWLSVNMGGGDKMTSMAFDGVTYVAVYQNGASSYVKKTTSLSAAWVTWGINPEAYFALSSVFVSYGDGKFVFASSGMSGNVFVCTSAQAAAGSQGSYAGMSLFTGSAMTNQVFYDQKSKLWFCFYSGNSTTTSYALTCKDLSVNIVNKVNLPALGAVRADSVSCIDGLVYVAIGGYYLYIIDLASNTVTPVSYPASDILLGVCKSNTSYLIICQKYLFYTTLKHLPMCSSPQENIFIKVL